MGRRDSPGRSARVVGLDVNMRWRRSVPLAAVPGLFLAGCAPSIELVGYGQPAPIQQGLEMRLISSGPSGALIFAKNTTGDLLSIAVTELAKKIEVRKAGQIVAPTTPIYADMRGEPEPDDFAILAPGQTREIAVHVSYEADQLRTPLGMYKIEKGPLYEIEVRIDPFFGRFTEANAGETLSRFKIPSYVRETLRVNSMTIRAR